MRKAASMFIFLVLGTACIVDLEPAETDAVESSALPDHGSADLAVMAARADAVRPDEATPGARPGARPGAGIDLDRACPGCNP